MEGKKERKKEKEKEKFSFFNKYFYFWLESSPSFLFIRILFSCGERGKWELLLNGDRSSVWEDEGLLETEGGDGHTTV